MRACQYLFLGHDPGSPTRSLIMGQLILNFVIFFARHMVLAFLGFLVLWVILDRKGTLKRALDRFSPGFGRRLAVGFSLVLLAGFIGVGVWYLNLDGFAGEVEPLVASLSWLVQNGQPLYHELEAAERYSVLYGPSVFLTNGLFLQVMGPSLFSAKIGSFLSILGCLVFLYAALARSSRDWVALFVTSLAALYFWSQGFAAYLVRPDALLLFSVGLALYAASKTGRLTALVSVAVMLGFAVNLKVHAVIYFFPVLVILGERFGWRRALLAVRCTLVVVTLLVVLARGLIRRTREMDRSLCVAWCLLPGLGIPVLVGGDHFGAFRFYQPLWPLFCLLAAWEWPFTRRLRPSCRHRDGF